jgi:hypothetical protein
MYGHGRKYLFVEILEDIIDKSELPDNLFIML